MNDEDQQEDLVDAGFNRLDTNAISRRPPKIQWGKLYREDMTKDQKIEYLEKLAATMNHAADKIQKERNKLGKLCELKEQQIEVLNVAVRNNNAMLQQEMTRMNENTQRGNKAFADLKRKVRELEAERTSGTVD